MKNNRVLLLVGFLVSLFFSIGKVNALVGPLEKTDSVIFEHNGQIHVISEREIPCLKDKNVIFNDYDLEGNFYFDSEDELIKVTKENTCVPVTTKDKFNIHQNSRYNYEVELDDNDNIVLNIYERRYEEAYYETQDTHVVDDKEYYIFDETNVEMVKFTSDTFDSGVTYYESGYVIVPTSNEQEENVTYYTRYSTYIIDNKLIYKVSEDYNKDEPLNYAIVNNDVLKPVKTIKLNQEIFKDLLNDPKIEDYEVMNIGEYYLIIFNDYEYVYDIEGNLIVSNGIAVPLGKDLYSITSASDNDYNLGIYYKNNKLTETKKYYLIVNGYFSEYYNLGLALKTTNEDDPQQVLVTHYIYDIIKGKNQKSAGTDLEFTFSGDISLFHRILIDDGEIEETNYTKESGSTIITLKSEYLKTLNNGTHKLKIEYKDGGYVETTFEVENVKNIVEIPNTLDNINTIIFLAISSSLIIVSTLVYLKKRNKKLA